VFKPEILTNLRRKWWYTKTSVYCEGFRVFKPGILTLEVTGDLLRQAFTVKAFLCLKQKY